MKYEKSAKRFCNRCKIRNNCTSRENTEKSYVFNVRDLKCGFQLSDAKLVKVQEIGLYVYETGISTINDWYHAKQLGLTQEDFKFEELKEMVETRIETNKGWNFRG